MKTKDEKRTPSASGEADDRGTPRTLTFAENAILTVKVLAIVGLVIGGLWALSLWTNAR